MRSCGAPENSQSLVRQASSGGITSRRFDYSDLVACVVREPAARTVVAVPSHDREIAAAPTRPDIMALTDAYLVKTGNVEDFFNAIQSGQAPERFTQKFLEQLGFKSTNDRLYIKLLKELEFLDAAGVPQQRYFDFLDQSQSRAILAEAITEAYSDLYTLNRNAHELSDTDVQNKLRSLTRGKRSDTVIRNSARTFKALSDYADWEGLARLNGAAGDEDDESIEETSANPTDETVAKPRLLDRNIEPQLHYNIQIHLPESRGPKVYDAIFQSLNKHLR